MASRCCTCELNDTRGVPSRMLESHPQMREPSQRTEALLIIRQFTPVPGKGSQREDPVRGKLDCADISGAVLPTRARQD